MRKPHTLQMKAFYLMSFKYLCATMLFLLFSSHLFAADILMGQYDFTTGANQLKASNVTQGITMGDIQVLNGTGTTITVNYANDVVETSNWGATMNIGGGKCINLSITKGSNASNFDVNKIIVTLKRTTANKLQVNFGPTTNTYANRTNTVQSLVGSSSYSNITLLENSTTSGGATVIAIPAVADANTLYLSIGTMSASASEVVYFDKIEVWGTVSLILTPTLTTDVASKTINASKNHSVSFPVNLSGVNLTADATISLTGTNPSNFSIDKTSITAATLTASSPQTITVTYPATTIGSHSANLHIESTGATSVDIPITATCDLFYEDFAGYDATVNTATILANLLPMTNNVSSSRVTGWSGNFLYQFKTGGTLASVCLGSTATDSAYITTPAMDLSQPFTLTFKARSLVNNATNGEFKVYLDGTQLIYSGTNTTWTLTDYTTPTFVGGTATSKLTFTGRKVAGNEIIIDRIVVNNSNCTNCDLTLTKDAALTISENKTYTNLSLAPGAKLTLGAGTLTVTNGLTLQSDANGTATIVDNNNSSPQAMSGTVQQYLATARNWYMSSPIVGATVPTGQTYYSYDESGNNTGFLAPASLYWVAVPEGATINPMKGYITQPGAAVTKSYTGTFNTGTKTVVLTRTNTATKPGFNLVANPYPSYLDWSLVDTTAANVLSSVWYRTKTTGGAYTFDTFNGGLNVATSNGENTVTKLIPPMQAFWVRVKSGFAGGTLTFDNTMRKHVDNVGNKFKAPALSETKLIRLRISNGTNADETLIAFNNKATNNLDSYDSPKMLNNNVDLPEIYTQVGDEKLVINGFKSMEDVTEVPLGFVAPKAGNFTLKINEFTNFDSATKVLLTDATQPGVTFDITDGSAYTFTADITPATTNRFSLIFRAPGITTGIENTSKLNAQVFVNSANQITIIAPVKSNYAIYNTVGQLIENGTLNSELQSVNYKLQTGIYVVKVGNQSNRVIVK